jgi:Putative zinc-finger
VSGKQCDDVRLALGALALGALEPGEEQEIRDHLVECPECAAEARSLSTTASALALVDVSEVVAAKLEPSPALLAGLLAEVRRQRWRRRLGGLAAAAAIAVAAGVGGAVLAGDSPDASADVPAPTASVTGQQQAVVLKVAAWDRGWGTAVQATVSGVPEGSRCSLVAVAADGTREIAATWQVPGNGYDDDGQLTVDGAVGLRSWDVDHYAVETVAGETLVTASQ